MGTLSRYKKEKEIAEDYYKSIGQVMCPYFKRFVVFNSDGFNHLQFSDGRERDKANQLLKFKLLVLVPTVVVAAGTVQEYRKQWGKVGRKKVNGFHETKEMEYWGFVAIVQNSSKENIKIRIIIRRVGDSNLTFWSVMPDIRLRGKDTYHLASGDISED